MTTEQMWWPILASEAIGVKTHVKVLKWERRFVTEDVAAAHYVTPSGLSRNASDATDFAGQGPRGDAGQVGSAGAPGSQGPRGLIGPPGSANNVHFTASFTIGQLLTLGAFTRDIAVTGVLAADHLHVMPSADLPVGIDLMSARPTANNAVRLRLRGFSLLTDNAAYTVSIVAMR